MAGAVRRGVRAGNWWIIPGLPLPPDCVRMKLLVVVLVLANLALFAWGRFDRMSESESNRLQRQLAPAP